MSLVDYALSDEEDESAADGEEDKERNKSNIVIPHTKPSNEKAHPPNEKTMVQQSESSSEPFSTLKLPNASFLLDSPSLPSTMSEKYDHNSRVAAAMAQNASRKRDSTTCNPRGKIPRGNLPVTKSGPDTACGLLRPPQLSGRSNVVTEDINKLFTKSSRPPS